MIFFNSIELLRHKDINEFNSLVFMEFGAKPRNFPSKHPRLWRGCLDGAYHLYFFC